MRTDRTTHIQHCLDRLAAGNLEARDELIALTQQRLRRLASGLLARDRIRRWEQTDDLLQEGVLRIHEQLAHVRPTTVAQFLKFASFHLRRELLRLARRHFGPGGIGANHASDGLHRSRARAQLVADAGTQPFEAHARAEELERLMDAIDQLSDELRDVVQMLWLYGLTRSETAAALEVDVRTVRRRWVRARLGLANALNGHARSARLAENEP